jgi:DNA-binding transcriptional ArsR family regulator
MHLSAMNDSSNRMHRFFEALGHASRFRLVVALCERERHVSELALEVGLSQSCTTRHLQALERAHVIHTRRSGKRVMAALALEQPHVAQVVTWLRGAGAPGSYDGEPLAERPAANGSPRLASRRSRPVAPATAPGAESPTADPPPVPRRPADMDDFLL